MLNSTHTTNAPKRFSISTLGCKVNAFESEQIAQQLAAQHYQRVDHNDHADLCVINTCTVTAEADRQARQLVRRAIRKNPDARVVVTGCYAQIDPQACASIPGVDLVVGNGRKQDIPTLLDALYQNQLPPVIGTDLASDTSPPQLLNGFDGRTRAFVQIQQGCDQGCTFCVIHTARGANHSFPARVIRRQVEHLVMNGYRELVICGVDIGSYGTDFAHAQTTDDNLTTLLKQLVAIDGDFRLRLSSLDPAHISDQLIDLIATEPKICPQLHLSLQSGNTLILKRMKRRATRELIDERINKLRRAVPSMVLSADILVGFPTETDEHFHETLNAVDALEIAYPHVFTYSSRPGTPAARIPDQVPTTERKVRASLVRERGKQVWNTVAKRHIGTQLKVLIETRTDLPAGMTFGRAANYFPVMFTSNEPQTQSGDWAQVEIDAIQDDTLIARRLD